LVISNGSNWKDKDRVFTISVDRYDDTMRAGILYWSGDETGVCIDSYPKLLKEIEVRLDQRNYPRANMKLRGLQRRETRTVGREEEPVRPEADQMGRLGIYTICVTHRRNASWQGIVSCPETQEYYRFTSFMKLVEYLDTRLRMRAGKAADQSAENAGQHFERCLSVVMEWSEKRKLLPNVYLYRCTKAHHTQTFIIRPMFYEHGTCQGILYWKEHQQQCRFRSFLELVSSISDVLENVQQSRQG